VVADYIVTSVLLKPTHTQHSQSWYVEP
jgi:hypothetical protein